MTAPHNRMHTPLPWISKETAKSNGNACSLFHEDRSKPGTWVRRLDSSGEFAPVDAKFIVRACNAHYELVAALEACAVFLKACESGGDILAGNALHKVLTTLAKAKP